MNSSHVRYALLMVICAFVAALPWFLSWLVSPLPPQLQDTATMLPLTRTARVDLPAAETLAAALGFTATPLPSATGTATPLPSATPTATATTTLIPSVTSTPTLTFTPLPVVFVTTLEKVKVYTCPGDQNKAGTIDMAQQFTILGWDQTVEDGKTYYWILVDDRMGQPQMWMRESEFVLITPLNYKDFLPRAACRVVSGAE